jgi:hypothetical protein
MESGMTGWLDMSISLNGPLMVVVALNPAAEVAHAVFVFIAVERATNTIATAASSRHVHCFGMFDSISPGGNALLEPHGQNETKRGGSQAVKDGIAYVSSVCRKMRSFAVPFGWLSEGYFGNRTRPNGYDLSGVSSCRELSIQVGKAHEAALGYPDWLSLKW